MQDDYAMQTHKKYTELLRGIITELPEFCVEYFRGIDNRTAIRTRYGYAVDLKVFLTYLMKQVPRFEHKIDITEFTLADIDSIRPIDIEMYLDFLSLYYRGNDMLTQTVNQCKAKARKLATLRSFYKFFYKREKITSTAPSMVDTPKIPDQPIIRLDSNEVVDLLNRIDTPDGMTKSQRVFQEKTKKRDIAILTLFLSTGVRISELVGIDVDDINFISNEFSVIRKGGKRDVLVFSVEARKVLLDYLLERENITTIKGHENALFLSLQKRRITVRAVENLVGKYAQLAVPQKHVTPHKLRSTFGTMLYAETDDIYLVADILGHRDVNTTKKHYADIAKERRRVAAEVIKLRNDNNSDNNK